MLSRLTINSTQTCNLGCKYCYSLGGEYGGSAMRILPELAVDRLRDAAREHGFIKLVQFIGGEPLLNLPAMEAVADAADELVTEGTLSEKPALSAITNLTIMSDEHIDVFRKHNFFLVISLDGGQEIHDLLRPTRKGTGTHAEIIDNVNLLKKHGIPFDIECTYTDRHVQAGISIIHLLRYFKETGAGTIDIVPVSTAPRDPLGFNEHSDWRTVVRMQLDALNFAIDEFEGGDIMPYGLLSEIIGQIRAPATDHFCPAGVSNLAVPSDGDLYQCNMFTNNDTYRTSVEAVTEVMTKADIAECQECWARPWCRSCVGNMEIRSLGDPHPYPQHCETLRGAISIVAQRLPTMLDKAFRSVEA